jgi:hypothetical protein
MSRAIGPGHCSALDSSLAKEHQILQWLKHRSAVEVFGEVHISLEAAVKGHAIDMPVTVLD